MTEEPDIVERLRNYNTCSDTDVDEAAAEIERLRKELNEARREILESLHPDLRKSYAAARGWDYLKENSND